MTQLLVMLIGGLVLMFLLLLFIRYRETRVYVPVFIAMSFIFSSVSDTRLTGFYNFYLPGVGYIYLSDIIILLAFFTLVLETLISGKLYVTSIDKLLVLLLAFWSVAFFRGLFIASGPSSSFWDAKRIVSMLVLPLTTNALTSKDQLRMLLRVMYVGIGIVVLSGVITYIVKGFMPAYQSSITFIGATQNALLVLMFCITVSIAAYSVRKGSRKLVLYLLSTLMILLVLMSYQRTGIIQAATALLFLMLFLPWRSRQEIMASLITFTLVLTPLNFLSHTFQESMNYLLLRIGKINLYNVGAQIRLAQWRVVIPEIIRHPFLGVGFGSVVWLPMPERYPWAPPYFTTPHSDFIHLAWKSGILSMLLYCGIILIALKKGIALLGHLRAGPLKALVLGCSANVFSLVFSSIVQPNFEHTLILLEMFLSIGIIFAIERIETSYILQQRNRGRPLR